MTNPSNSVFDIHVTAELPGAFLSSRWGDVEIDHNHAETWCEDAKVTSKDVQAAIESNPHCFEDEACFLIGMRNPDGTPGEIGIWVEFELSEEYLPEPFHDESTDADMKDWRSAFSLFAPAMLHAVKGIAEIQQNLTSELRCFFHFDAPSGGAISVFVPLSATEHVKKVIDLLFQNGLPFPASSHMKMGALAQLHWVPSKGIPGGILPGNKKS